MASIAGRYGFPNRSPYAATKWAVIGLTKTLAMELGEWGIRANAIAPGAVEGDRIVRVFQGRAQISGRSLEEVKSDALAASSIKEMVDPKDIAQLAVFLASDAAKSISGQVIPIDNDRQKAWRSRPRGPGPPSCGTRLARVPSPSCFLEYSRTPRR